MPLQAQLELPSAFVLLSFEQLQQLEYLLVLLLLVPQLVLRLAPLELQFGLRLESQESRQL